jgi:ribosomal protein S18 acetylase RimI-like enzyme
MEQGQPMDALPNNLEKHFKVEIATPDEWEAYRDLRLQAITGKDADMYSITSDPERLEKVKNRSEEEWKNDLSRPDVFVVITRSNSEVIGIGVARKKEEEIWHMGAGYTKEEFRGIGVGKKMFAKRLDEIVKRGGKKVTVGAKHTNTRSIHISESFGFKLVNQGLYPTRHEEYLMELDLTDPEVIKKINETLK